MFDAILSLQPFVPPSPDIANAAAKNKYALNLLGQVLAKAIMPPLEEADYTNDRVDLLFHLIEGGLAPSVIGALPSLIRVRHDVETRLVDLVNNLDRLAESKQEVLARVRSRVPSYEARSLRRASDEYGNVRTRKFFREALTAAGAHAD